MEKDSSVGSPPPHPPGPCRRPPSPGWCRVGGAKACGRSRPSQQEGLVDTPAPPARAAPLPRMNGAISSIRGAAAKRSRKHVGTHSGVMSSPGLRAGPVLRDWGVSGRGRGCFRGLPGASAASAAVMGSCRSGKMRTLLPPLWGPRSVSQSGPLSRFTRLGQCSLPPPP